MLDDAAKLALRHAGFSRPQVSGLDTNVVAASGGSGLPDNWTEPGGGQVLVTKPSDNTKVALQFDLGAGAHATGDAPALDVKGGDTGRHLFTAHETGGICVTCRGEEPQWGTVHLFGYDGQTRPLLIITKDVQDVADNRRLFVVEESGQVAVTPRDLSNADDFLLKVLTSASKVGLQVNENGEILGAPVRWQLSVEEDPIATSTGGVFGTFNNSVAFLRWALYRYDSVVGEWAEWDFGMPAGSYYLDAYVVGKNNQGAFDVGIDTGTADAVACGNVDCYDASGTDVEKKVTLGPFTIPNAGRHRIRLTHTTKNASSSADYANFRHLTLRRA